MSLATPAICRLNLWRSRCVDASNEIEQLALFHDLSSLIYCTSQHYHAHVLIAFPRNWNHNHYVLITLKSFWTSVTPYFLNMLFRPLLDSLHLSLSFSLLTQMYECCEFFNYSSTASLQCSFSAGSCWVSGVSDLQQLKCHSSFTTKSFCCSLSQSGLFSLIVLGGCLGFFCLFVCFGGGFGFFLVSDLFCFGMVRGVM